MGFICTRWHEKKTNVEMFNRVLVKKSVVKKSVVFVLGDEIPIHYLKRNAS